MSQALKLCMATLLLAAATVASAAQEPLEARQDHIRTVFVEYYDAVDSDRSIRSLHVNIGIGYSPWKNVDLLWIGTLARNNGYSIDEYNRALGKMNNDSTGIGTSAMVRLHLFRTRTLSLYLDASSGIIYFDRKFPSRGTHWNFYHKAGIGASYHLSPSSRLELTYRRMHISNGKGLGNAHNPSIDSDGISMGYRHSF